MKRTALISLAMLAVTSVAPAATVTVIDYSPSVRFGGFEGDSPAADFPNGASGANGWQLNGGENRITNANDTGYGLGTGPTTASGGGYFAWLPAVANNTKQLTNQPNAFNLAPLPLTNVSSFTLTFDYAGSTTSAGGFNPALTKANVRVWNGNDTKQQGYDFLFLPDASPTTWQSSSSFTVNGPFLHDDLTPLAEIGKFRVQFFARTASGDADVVNGHLFIDNVRLTFNVVPEPGSLALLVVGSPALLFLRRRRMK